MTLTQTLIVLFVGLFTIKLDDIPIIIKKIKRIKSYFYTNDQINNSVEIEQLNFYIQKIINIKGCYDGNYDLITVKEKYNKLIKSVIDNDLNNRL